MSIEGKSSVDKFHIRHLTLYEFRKHINALSNAVHPCPLDSRTCQRWFKKFKNDHFNLVEGIKFGRHFENLLMAKSEVDSKQIIQELVKKLAT